MSSSNGNNGNFSNNPPNRPASLGTKTVKRDNYSSGNSSTRPAVPKENTKK